MVTGGGRLSFLELVKSYRVLLELSGGDDASVDMRRVLAEKVVEDALRRGGAAGTSGEGASELVGALIDAG